MPCIPQRMFTYAEESGCKECEWTIHQDCQQLVPRADVKAKTPAIQMVGFRTTRKRSKESIMRCTNKRGYQGHHHMGQSGMEALDQEICTSLEEQTWQRWGATRLEEDGGSHCKYFAAKPPDQIPSPDPNKTQGPPMSRLSMKPGRHIKEH